LAGNDSIADRVAALLYAFGAKSKREAENIVGVFGEYLVNYIKIYGVEVHNIVDAKQNVFCFDLVENLPEVAMKIFLSYYYAI